MIGFAGYLATRPWSRAISRQHTCTRARKCQSRQSITIACSPLTAASTRHNISRTAPPQTCVFLSSQPRLRPQPPTHAFPLSPCYGAAGRQNASAHRRISPIGGQEGAAEEAAGYPVQGAAGRRPGGCTAAAAAGALTALAASREQPRGHGRVSTAGDKADGLRGSWGEGAGSTSVCEARPKGFEAWTRFRKQGNTGDLMCPGPQSLPR